jgi:hypothetical protein
MTPTALARALWSGSSAAVPSDVDSKLLCDAAWKTMPEAIRRELLIAAVEARELFFFFVLCVTFGYSHKQ